MRLPRLTAPRQSIESDRQNAFRQVGAGGLECSNRRNLPTQRICRAARGGGCQARSRWCCRAVVRWGPTNAGVYQTLQEAGIEPDWIIGTSIGAINASLIAANEPQRRLERMNEFWSRVQCAPHWIFRDAFPASARDGRSGRP
jgi:hypothetical protein